MIYYHGTTLEIAKKIKAEGLIPHRQTAFNFWREGYEISIREDEGNEPLIYISTNLKLAGIFADFRTRYEKAKKGEYVSWGPYNRMQKLSSHYVLNASPAIVKMDVPLTITRKFQDDPDGEYIANAGARICSCVIPSEYVTEIIEVKEGIYVPTVD
jgi:hypothetical protein